MTVEWLATLVVLLFVNCMNLNECCMCFFFFTTDSLAALSLWPATASCSQPSYYVIHVTFSMIDIIANSAQLAAGWRSRRNTTYRLQLLASWWIHNVFHAAFTMTIQRKWGLWTELLEGEEVYQVETILSHRKRGQEYQYYVKWQWYPISDASWKLEHSFSNNGDILTYYKLQHELWTCPAFHSTMWIVNSGSSETTCMNLLDSSSI